MASAKRKNSSAGEPSRKRPRSGSPSDEDSDSQARVFLLEAAILESKKNYNEIASLIEMLRHQQDRETALAAAVALCRVFIRLLAAGALVRSKDQSEKDSRVAQWLRGMLAEYKDALISLFSHSESDLTALTLCMRLLKSETQAQMDADGYHFPQASLRQIVKGLLGAKVDGSVRKEFVEKFVDEYDDIRYYTFRSLRETLQTANPAIGDDELPEVLVGPAFDVLAAIEGVPESNAELEDFYVEAPIKKSHALYSLNQHKKQAQEAWLTLLKMNLDKDKKKRVLDIMSRVIAPWFTQPELLMDFLTDCYDSGGSMSLLALSGLFYLIQERNLDYPSFYSKLYSLLDADLLHSKHRSRFLRLLDTFLESSHLPAALVSSFIKRMSRLCLNAPPGAILAVVPWIYNLFKKHPMCTFMIHRVPQTEEQREQYDAEGMLDPFLPDEPDPMETCAIDSCLWELVQLQNHYHPNVATIAKIISEQFTKQFYKLEDFLDHSYGSLLEVELSKDIKKPPVVEFMIPKRILSPNEAITGDGETSDGHDVPAFNEGFFL